MQALIYTGQGRRLEWQERPDLKIEGDLEAIVRPIASSPCDLDRGIFAGRTPFGQATGFAIGHECVAEVLAIGDKVRTVRPGDVVVVPFKVSCGTCHECRAGLQAHCTRVPGGGRGVYGVPVDKDWGGLYSEEVRVPFADAMLTPTPEGVDPAYLTSVSDNLTDSYISVRRGLAKHPGGRVLVVGGIGSFCLFVVDCAMALGAERVDYWDRDPARREVARGMGAEVLEDLPPDTDRIYHLVIFGSTDVRDLIPTVAAMRPNGHCHIVMMFFKPELVPLSEMFFRDASISIGMPSVKPHVHEVCNLVKCGHLHPERLITVHDESQAIDALLSAEIKPVIVRPRLLVPR